MILPVALTAAGAAALINIWLGARASQVRMSQKIVHGDGGNPLMLRRMRAHANFTENAPFFLILLALLEFAGGRADALWAAAALFILARLAHPFGMERDGPNALRIVGMIGTWSVIGALALWAIALTYQAVEPAASPERPDAPATKA